METGHEVYEVREDYFRILEIVKPFGITLKRNK
jgi:hypothetical protein